MGAERRKQNFICWMDSQVNGNYTLTSGRQPPSTTPTVPVAFAPAQVSHANVLETSCAKENWIEHGRVQPLNAKSAYMRSSLVTSTRFLDAKRHS